jgi:hypothetical protein
MAGKARVLDETDRGKKPKKQAEPPQPRGKNKARQPQPSEEKRPSQEKHTARPHPEVPPRKRPSPSPKREPQPTQEQIPSEPSPARVPLTQAQGLQELVKRASDGNEACLVGLRDFLDKHPDIWEVAGNLSALAERHWTEVIANGNALAELSIPRRLQSLRTELLGSDPTPLEKLLVDVIGVSWLAAQHGEIVASRQDGSVQQIASRLRRAESGQRRLLSAVKSLAVVRALLPRALPEPAKKAR